MTVNPTFRLTLALLTIRHRLGLIIAITLGYLPYRPDWDRRDVRCLRIIWARSPLDAIKHGAGTSKAFDLLPTWLRDLGGLY